MRRHACAPAPAAPADSRCWPRRPASDQASSRRGSPGTACMPSYKHPLCKRHPCHQDVCSACKVTRHCCPARSLARQQPSLTSTGACVEYAAAPDSYDVVRLPVCCCCRRCMTWRGSCCRPVRRSRGPGRAHGRGSWPMRQSRWRSCSPRACAGCGRRERCAAFVKPWRCSSVCSARWAGSAASLCFVLGMQRALPLRVDR